MGRTDGALTLEELKRCPGWPGDKNINIKKVAVLECVEDIPCDPCEIACPSGAIIVGRPITNLPRIDPDRCTGCGLCIPACPGLAIFIIEKNYSDELAALSLPYELLPLPAEGQRVMAFDRNGRYVCDAVVKDIRINKKFDKTYVVTVLFEKKYVDEVRSIKITSRE